LIFFLGAAVCNLHSISATVQHSAVDIGAGIHSVPGHAPAGIPAGIPSAPEHAAGGNPAGISVFVQFFCFKKIKSVGINVRTKVN
jgi:hypothetical protein